MTTNTKMDEVIEFVASVATDVVNAYSGDPVGWADLEIDLTIWLMRETDLGPLDAADVANRSIWHGINTGRMNFHLGDLSPATT